MIYLHFAFLVENICTKSLKFMNITKTLVSYVNFIKSKVLNHRQRQQFLQYLKLKYGDIVFHYIFRWPSKGKILKQFYKRKAAVFFCGYVCKTILIELLRDNT